MGFADAMTELEAGRRVTRSGWNGKDMWVGTGIVHAFSSIDIAHKDTISTRRRGIVMKTAQGDVVPWHPSGTDMVATDWRVLP